MPKSTDNNASGGDLASRLRQAARQTDNGVRATQAGAASSTGTPPSWAADNSVRAQQPAYQPPVYQPAPSGSGGNRTIAIVVGAAVAVVVLGIAAFALLGAAGESSQKKFTEVPASIDGAGVYAGIQGYALAAAPQADIDAVRNAVVSRTDAANVSSVDGRMVAKGGKNVAESFAIVFNPSSGVNPQVGVDAVASQLATSKPVTIAGATGIYGKTSGGAELIVVYTGNTGIVVTGSSRGTLEDITAKLVANA